jgi:hypothetical protein
MQRKLVYPAPRFEAPIFMRHESFKWRPTGHPGVWAKTLGVFTERELRVEMVKLDAGVEWSSPPGNAIVLSFVFDGSGDCGGKTYRQYSVIETTSGESLNFRADAATEIVRLIMPMLHLDRQRKLTATDGLMEHRA